MAHLDSLVVFDAQPRTREALVFGFEREGLEVFAAGEGQEVLSSAQARRPQLVVVSLPPERSNGSVPKIALDGLSLIGRLREEPATRELPIVALGERVTRENALRAGADEFVSRPAFIRDVLTLARLAVALRQDGNDEGVAGMLEDYQLFFLVRAMSVAGRSGVIELERGGRSGELQLQRGEVISARCGRMSGTVAFNHLLLWGEASMQLRLVSPTGERKIDQRTEELLAAGGAFAREFEAIAGKVGGALSIFRQEPRRVAEAHTRIPTEVMQVLKIYDGKRPLIDIVEDSPFKALDTIKVTYRLLEMGVLERVSDSGGPSPLTAALAVRDWLLGASPAEEPRTTVTEAGRRAAEAYAEEQARRAAAPPPPAAELLDDTERFRRQTQAAPLERDETPTAAPRKGPPPRNKKRRRHNKVAPAPAVAEAQAALPSMELRPSVPDTPIAATIEEDTTTPFARIALEAPSPTAPPPKVKDVHFTDVEEEFFARESEIHKAHMPETFEDLEPIDQTTPKRRWFNFGEKFSTPAKKGPQKKR